MNAVEIEQAITTLAEQPFDAAEFPYAFLAAFGNKETTLKRLRNGVSNKSDIGGVLQTNNIHIATCRPGEIANTLALLKSSPATTRAKARFVLATDGDMLQAEDLSSDDAPVSCTYKDFPNHFGFFLPLAGITTVKQIRESSFDIRATSRLNKLYVELLKDNPSWGTAERRPDMNHFMARLIFCFFAEKTDIFEGNGRFTATIDTLSAKDSSNTHDVISTLFRAMNIKREDRAREVIPRWANDFPYVNGGLFSGSIDTPRFSRIARSFLLHIGSLDWRQINPDIFGSMIQAVADDDERGSLGMHYTSVPNILKVLNPLFLDDIRTRLADAGNNARILLNIRRNLSRIRIFDPACGSGNFLVIAYKEMREIEAEINRRRGEPDRRSDIPLTNFRGIELRSFSAEIARLALIIAEFQCDVIYRGQKEALADFLPLDDENWITCGNALKLDWLSICPPRGISSTIQSDDLFSVDLRNSNIEYENEPTETYICGNPPYAGLSSQDEKQKNDLKYLFDNVSNYWKSFDYVCCWFWKGAEYIAESRGKCAFVTTNSICQGQQVPMFWPLLLKDGVKIEFAHTSFKWSNLAARNAGVTVVIVGLGITGQTKKTLFTENEQGEALAARVDNINAYLVPGDDAYVQPTARPPSDRPTMFWGNKPVDGGYLILSNEEALSITNGDTSAERFIKPYYGSSEFIRGAPRKCIWVPDQDLGEASAHISFRARFERVKEFRLNSKANETKPSAKYPHRFRQIQGSPGEPCLIIPIHSSESRNYLPAGLLPEGAIISNAAYAIYNPDTYYFSIIASRLHLVWIAAICGKIKTDFRYSNTLGWNTFPIPALTEKNKLDLTKCGEEILLAREAEFPATIADLYDPKCTPANLTKAHQQNDELIERIYIGRRFRNDTERLEKLFELYHQALINKNNVPTRKHQGVR